MLRPLCALFTFPLLLAVAACAPAANTDDAGTSDAGEENDDEGDNPPWLPATVDLVLSEHDGVSPSLPNAFEGREGLYWPSILHSYGANDDDGHCMSGNFFSLDSVTRVYQIADNSDENNGAQLSFSTSCRQSEEFEGRYQATHTWHAAEGTLEVLAVQPRLRFKLSNVRMEPSNVSSEPTEGTFVINGEGEIRIVR